MKGRVSELEAELAEQSHLRLQAAGESEFLKAELEDLRRVREDTEKEHRSVTEIESKPDPSVRVAVDDIVILVTIMWKN